MMERALKEQSIRLEGILRAPANHRRWQIQESFHSKQLRAVSTCATGLEKKFKVSTITDLEGWLKDNRNQSLSSQCDGFMTLKKHVDDPFRAPRVMSGILKKISGDSSFVTKARKDELFDVAKTLFEGCANIADTLAPDQVVYLVDIYTLLFELQEDPTRPTTVYQSKKEERLTANKWAQVQKYATQALNAALPSAMTGATMQQLLACTRMLSTTGLAISRRLAFQAQLAESIALPASYERFTDTCSLQDLADVVAELMLEDGVNKLTKDAVSNIKSATDRLVANSGILDAKKRRRRTKVVRRSSSPQGHSTDNAAVSDENSDGDDVNAGNFSDVIHNQLPDHAAIVAQFFLQLPADLAVDCSWTYDLTMKTLSWIWSKPQLVSNKDGVVELCHEALHSHQWTHCKASLQHACVLRCCEALVALSKVDSWNSVFDAPMTPKLMQALVDIVISPGSTLMLPKEFISALLSYAQNDVVGVHTKPKGVVLYGPKQQQKDSTVCVMLDCLVQLSECECNAGTEYGKARLEMKKMAQDAINSLLTGKPNVKEASSQVVASGGTVIGIQTALTLLDIAVTRNIPLPHNVQEDIEQQILKHHNAVSSRARMQALLNLLSFGKPVVKHELLYVCLLPLEDLSSQLSPQQLARVISVVAAAEWADKTPSRERLLAAARDVLARFTDISQCEALVKAAGALNAITPTQTRSIRRFDINYHTVGPKVCASTVESLFAKPQSAFITSGAGPHDIISILWSLCLQLNAQPSPQFIATQLQPLADDSNPEMSFEACSSDDLVKLMQLVHHWKATPTANDWLLKLVETAETKWFEGYISGTQMGLALECLPTIADPSLQAIRWQHTDVEANAHTVQHPQVRVAVKHLASNLATNLLTTTNLATFIYWPELLARVVDVLYVLQEQPTKEWLKNFERVTSGFLEQIAAASPTALVRMLWLMQQLGHTPKLLWVSMLTEHVMAWLSVLTASSPAELPTLLACLHVSLTEPQTQFEQANRSSKTHSNRRQPSPSSSSTDAFAGTAFASENVQSLGVYHQEITRSMVEIASMWLKGFDTNRSLVTDIDSRILLVAIQALAVMQLPVDDPLNALLDKKLPVAPGYKPPPPVTLQQESKKRASRGKAAKQAAKAVVKVEFSKAHIPNDVWVLTACTAIQKMQRNSAGAPPVDVASQRGLVAALLTLQKGTGSQEPSVDVKKTIQSQLNFLIDLNDSTGSGTASNSLTPEDCIVLIKACQTCSVEIPTSLTSHYLSLEAEQGLIRVVAALDKLQELGFPIQMWQYDLALLTLRQQTTALDVELQANELGTLAALLPKLIAYKVSLSAAESEKHVDACRNIITVLRTYLSRAVLAEVIANDSIAAASYLSCVVSCSQLDALCSKDSSAQIHETVAVQCLADVNRHLPQSLLQQAIVSAAKALTAESPLARLHVMHMAITLGEANNHPMPPELLSKSYISHCWDLLQPNLLYEAYGSNEAWAPVLCHQLLKVLGIVEDSSGVVQNKRFDIPPSVEWITQFLVLYRDTTSNSMDLRVLVLLNECGVLTPDGLSVRLGKTPAPASLALYQRLLDTVRARWVQGSVWTAAQDMHIASVILQATYVLPAYLSQIRQPNENLDWSAINSTYWESSSGLEEGGREVLQAQLSSLIPKLNTAWRCEDDNKNVRRWSQELMGLLCIQSVLEAPISLQQELEHLAMYMNQLTSQEQARLLTAVLHMSMANGTVFRPLSMNTRQAILKLACQPRLLLQPGGADLVHSAIGIAVCSSERWFDVEVVQQAITDEQARQIVEDVLRIKVSKTLTTQKSTLIAMMAVAVSLVGQKRELRIPHDLAKKLVIDSLDVLSNETSPHIRSTDCPPVTFLSMYLLRAILTTPQGTITWEEMVKLYKVNNTLFNLFVSQESIRQGNDELRAPGIMVHASLVNQLFNWDDHRIQLGGLHMVTGKAWLFWQRYTPTTLIQVMELVYINTGRLPADSLSGAMLGYMLAGNGWLEAPWSNNEPEQYLVETAAIVRGSTADVLHQHKTWGHKALDEHILHGIFNILTKDDEKLDPWIPGVQQNPTISWSYFGCFPYIARQYDDVWRWSLLYGMALHCCNNCSEELMQQIKDRYVQAGNEAIQKKPSIQAVITWLAPLITGKVSMETPLTFDIPKAVPAKSWIQQADWSSLLNLHQCESTMMFQIVSCFIRSPQFHTLFSETCARKLAELINQKTAVDDSWVSDAVDLFQTKMGAQEDPNVSSFITEGNAHGRDGNIKDINLALGYELLNKDHPSIDVLSNAIRFMPAVSLLVFWQRVNKQFSSSNPQRAVNDEMGSGVTKTNLESAVDIIARRQFVFVSGFSRPIQHLHNTEWETVIQQLERLEADQDGKVQAVRDKLRGAFRGVTNKPSHSRRGRRGSL